MGRLVNILRINICSNFWKHNDDSFQIISPVLVFLVNVLFDLVRQLCFVAAQNTPKLENTETQTVYVLLTSMLIKVLPAATQLDNSFLQGQSRWFNIKDLFHLCSQNIPQSSQIIFSLLCDRFFILNARQYNKSFIERLSSIMHYLIMEGVELKCYT